MTWVGVLVILKTVRETIDRHDLIADGRKVLVAVSGGVDSVVLAHLLSRLAAKRFWDLSIGHINHGLRGEESDEDEHFVRKFSKKLGISCCVGRIDPRDWTPGANRQEQARELRYRLLQAFAGEGDAILATAHHADDQAETVLERLLRGAGVDGLSGMAMKRENIVRPLLGVSRPEILTYARRWKLEWREDSSNENLKYTRNRYRKRILPLLEVEAPRAARQIARSAGLLRDTREALEFAARERLDGRMTVEKDGNIARLDVRDVHAWPHGLRTAFWREGVARWNPARGYFREEHWEAIDRAALTPEKPERIRLPGGIEVRREAGELVFRTECFEKCMNQEDFERILPVPGRLSLPEGELECFRLKAGLDPDFSNYFNIFLPETGSLGHFRYVFENGETGFICRIWEVGGFQGFFPT